MASSPQQINPETKKRVYSLFGEYTRKNNLQFTGLLTGNNAVVAEHTSYRELAELVTNHVFGNEYRNKALAVIELDKVAKLLSVPVRELRKLPLNIQERICGAYTMEYRCVLFIIAFQIPVGSV